MKDRLSPFERATPEGTMEAVREIFLSRYPGSSTALMDAAWVLAYASHQGQFRKSGEEYIYHPLAVAHIVAKQGMDEVTIAAALLHDAVEDTDVSLDELTNHFGPELAHLVDGVTKIDALPTESRTDAQAATLRKMFIAVASDLRVLIIKLADRTHNMLTIGAQAPHKQERIAQETLDVYAPLAARLGMQDTKTLLEDLSFATLHPKWYVELGDMLRTRAPERNSTITDVTDRINHDLTIAHVEASISARPKELWSIYQKMVTKGYEFDQLHDLVGVRIITDSVKDCYAALGVVHAAFPPVPNRFKDYIAVPKDNLYQSLHTTVRGPKGASIEFQIRTHAMDAKAKYGVAAHWVYKEGGRAPDASIVNTLVDWQQADVSPEDFLTSLKKDLSSEDIYVLTPMGDIKTLPTGAVALDMAYAIHSEVGNKTIGARINGRLAKLDTALHSGDEVEIITSKAQNAGPSRDWLQVAKTSKAQHRIKAYFATASRADDILAGRTALADALKRAHQPLTFLDSKPLADVAELLKYQNLEALYLALGQNKATIRSVLDRLVPPTPKRSTPKVLLSKNPIVTIAGQSGLATILAKCCSPVPGDAVAGYVTQGRGVTIHREDCSNLIHLRQTDPSRVLSADWEDGSSTSSVTVEMRALDRPNLLRDATQVFSDLRTPLVSNYSTARADRSARIQFTFQVSSVEHISGVIQALRSLDGVYSVERVTTKN